MLHAGWRGILAGAIGNFFRVLRSEFSVEGRDVFVGAGPSLCVNCAEFGVDHEILKTLPPNLVSGRLANLAGEATRQLFECGVTPDRIERHPDCPRCSPEKYWSYRGGHKQEVMEGHTNMLVAMLM